MEYIYPAQTLYSNSTLFSGFNPVRPTPVENTTFYEDNLSRGDLFHLSDTDSEFHPDATNGFCQVQKAFKMSRDDTGYPSSSTASSSQMTCERFDELTYFDEDVFDSDVNMEFSPRALDGDEHLVGAQYHQFLPSDQWQGWEAMDSRLVPIPVATARSSLECTPPKHSNYGIPWEGGNEQSYDLRIGHESPQPSFDRCEMFSGPWNVPSIQPLYSQPQNTPSSIASSSIYHTSLSNTVSPSASSDTSSASSSTLSTPELTIRTPITLHQPRPSRRIPIVSLSELALACDDFAQSPPIQSLPYQDLISPLNLDFPAEYTSVYSPEHPDEPKIDTRSHHQEQKYPHQFHIAPTSYVDDRAEEVLLCSCGCMDSSIPQNNPYGATYL